MTGHRLRIALLAVLLALASPTTGPSAEETPAAARWESHGPHGGLVVRLEFDEADPSRILLYSARGHDLSRDGGTSWERVPLPAGETDGTRPMIFHHGRLWCGLAGHSFSSRDGREWEEDLPLGVDGQVVLLLGERGKAGRLWAGVVLPGPDGSSGVSLLVREERRWRETFSCDLESAPGLAGANENNPIVAGGAKGRSLRAFLRLGWGGALTFALRSEDGGETWRSRAVVADILGADFAADGPDVLWAAGSGSGPMPGLLRSEDGGLAWSPACDDPRVKAGLRTVRRLRSGRLLLGTEEHGLLATDDGGKSLVDLGAGLVNRCVLTVAEHPEKPEILLAGTQCGVYRSTDAGRSWTPSFRGFAGCQCPAPVACPGEPDRLLAFDWLTGPRVSTDGGRSWSPPDPDWCAKHGRPHRLTTGGGAILVVARDFGRQRDVATLSRDGGRTWTRIAVLGGPGAPPGNASFALGEKAVYRVDAGERVVRSADGDTWTPFAGPFPETGGSVATIALLAGGKRLLVAGPAGIAVHDTKTAQSAGSMPLPPHAGPPDGFVADPASGGVVWSSGPDGTLWRGDLGAKAWKDVHLGPGGIASMVTDPGKPCRRIAGFRDGDVAISDDDGATWRSIDPDPEFRFLRGLAVTSKRVLVAVANGAVFTLDLAGID